MASQYSYGSQPMNPHHHQPQPYITDLAPPAPPPTYVEYSQEKVVAQQPQGGMQMQMQQGGGNRNVKNLPYDEDGREWSHGLCSCCSDCGKCCFACWCPCMSYARNKRRLEHLNNTGTPDPEKGGSGCGLDCLLHAGLNMLVGCGWVLQISTRGNMRSRYRIKGGGCGDCMTAWCCSCCELVQESRELELEEQSFGQY